MIILILLILLSQNKYYNKSSNNGYLFLLLLLFLSMGNCNIYSNAFENIYIPPNKPNDNSPYNSHKTYNNCTPYNKDDYLKNSKKAPVQESSNKNNTYSFDKYYPKKQYYDNTLKPNCGKANIEQCISIITSDKTNSIDTISCKDNFKSPTKEIKSNISNKHSLKNSLKPTSTNSVINKNINGTKLLTLNNNKNPNNTLIANATSYSIDSLTKTSGKPSIEIDNITQGQSITVVLEGFGSITGKVLSHFDNVISLKLNNNKTIYINTDFISFLY